MEWLKTLLKNAGIEESKVEEIVKDYNQEAPKHIIPKEKYNEVADTKKQLEKDIAIRDQQIDDLKKVDADGLKEEIEKLQKENKEAKEKYEKEMKELSLNNALKLNLANMVHDPDIVLNLLDKTKIELDDQGNIKGGLDDQIKTLKESKSFLFVEEKKEPFAMFKGVKPVDGKEPQSVQNEEGAFGKKLAEFASKNNALSEARENYFK